MSFLRYSMSKNVVTLKSGLKVTQGHWEWYNSNCVWFPISVLWLLIPKMHCFWDIRLQKCCDLENRVRGSVKVKLIVYWECYRSIECIWLPIDVLSISFNQFNSNLAAREPDSKWYAVEITDKNSIRNKMCIYVHKCWERCVESVWSHYGGW